jgi:hypothetical protein
MRYIWIIGASGFALSVGGCGALNPVQHLVESNRKSEESFAARCRDWEDQAARAAHPDAQLIAFHDQLQQKADAIQARVSAEKGLHGDALFAASAEIVQAQMRADDVYDVKDKLQNAAECWQGLGMVRDVHADMMQRLSQFGNYRPPVAAIEPQPRSYTLDTQPPPMPAPAVTAPSEAPPKPKTWMDTPYAPMVPPVMRDQPVTDPNPAVPPAARDNP